MDKGFFSSMFDFHGDGKLDSFEKVADFVVFVNLTSSTDGEADTDEHNSAFSLSSDKELEEDYNTDECDF